MAKFIFDSYTLPCGTLKMSFENDWGTQIINCGGNFLLKLASLKETVEENGIGGIPRITDMEIELFDRDGWFKNTILNKLAPITKCYANFTLTVSEVEYSIIYGTIDLSTVEYETLYDDGSGNEQHKCRFIVLSIISALKSIPMLTLRGILDGYKVEGRFDFTYLNITDLFQQIFGMLYPGKEIAIGYNLPFTLNSPAYGDFDPQAGSFFYTLDGEYTELWGDGSASFMGMRDVQSFLSTLCSMMLVYPIIFYSPAIDSLNVNIIHRNGGNVVTPGVLLTSIEKSFYGYDAVRVNQAGGYVDRRMYPGDAAYQNGISDEQFDLISQKFDFHNYLWITSYNHYAIADPDLEGFASLINDTELAQSFTSWNQWLITKFVSYWTEKKMYDRKYQGVGIGENPVNLLDKLVISGEQYSIFEIERNFVANEMKIQCVQY